MPRDLNFGAKDFLKERIRIRDARKPSVIEVLILGLQNNAAPISDAAVPSKLEGGRVLE